MFEKKVLLFVKKSVFLFNKRLSEQLFEKTKQKQVRGYEQQNNNYTAYEQDNKTCDAV